jgi:hypothetical protein
MPIATGIEHQPIFVLQEESDAYLISHWNRTLPELSNLCLRDYSQLRISSIHLFRVGTDEFSSKPTIIVNTAEPLEANEKMQIQWSIAAFSDLTLNSTLPSSVARITPPQLQLLFRQSRFRRSLHAPSLPPICKPRNRQFSSKPDTGASIGIAGSFEDTATLGCYLLIDKTPVVLTVDHLISELHHRQNGMITHISQQDRFEILLPAMIQEIGNVSSRTDHTCYICRLLVMHSLESIHHFAKASLIWFDDIGATRRNSCPFYGALETLFKSHEWHEVRRIAKIHAQSGPRFRVLGNERREMDWALFGVMLNDTFSFGLGEHIMFQHEMALEIERPKELQLQPSKPGAFVRSLGRTSGHQIGRISTTTSAIFHGAYTTQEWTVIKRHETPLNEWVEGGIGVEGDSGALIVDENTEAVYGMLWGRSGDGPATVTIFTPMQDILKDIQERTKTDQVQLLRGQQMPRPEKAENLEAPVESVPILVSLDENVGDLILEEGMASVSITRQSSADMRQPHSFERYRGRDGTDRSVPRNTTETTAENIESSQWPGVHTYLRYTVAPEQE